MKPSRRAYLVAYRRRNHKKIREYARLYYHRNKKKAKATMARLRANGQSITRAAKNKPCADCGKRYPYYVMDFDHVRGRKVNKVSGMVTYNTEKLRAEIRKCDVVCANCHRARTWRRRYLK